jgi:hypothetical protein
MAAEGMPLISCGAIGQFGKVAIVLFEQAEDGLNGDFWKSAPLAIAVIEHQSDQDVTALAAPPKTLDFAKVGIEAKKVHGVRFDPHDGFDGRVNHLAATSLQNAERAAVGWQNRHVSEHIEISATAA